MKHCYEQASSDNSSPINIVSHFYPIEDLLQLRHPHDKYHQAQLQFLQALSAEQRPYHARLFRLGNASYRYQQLAAGEVTEEDYRDWLECLPTRMRDSIEREGFEKSKGSLR